VRPQPRERGLELQRFVHGLLHEQLDRVLAPGAERAAAEAARETFDAGKAHAFDLRGFAVKHRHTGVDENLPDLVLLARLVIVIPEDCDDRNLDCGRELTGEDARFVRQAVIGEIAAQRQHIRAAADLGEKGLESALRVPRDVNVANRGHPQVCACRGHPLSAGSATRNPAYERIQRGGHGVAQQ
jgi:hypothetical protein